MRRAKKMSDVLDKRYEFVLFFEVENGNPNGDPDAGNMPRIDPETSHGLVTDVCLKRKVRNYIELAKKDDPHYDIYVKENAVLNRINEEAYKAQNIKPETKKLPKDADQAKEIVKYMCQRFYDIRAFGAVMTTEINCGQVRGPVQFSFAKSLDPIVPQEVTITRMAVTNEKDAEKERTMGRKHIVPYGLYRAEGYISASLAEKTGYTQEDLNLFWKALMNMFEHDHSAARGKMASRKLVIFGHETTLGNAPAHRLFDLVTAKRKDEQKPPRAFSDYEIVVNYAEKPEGITIIEK
jgi:CRISPR-associated protein Csd2